MKKAILLFFLISFFSFLFSQNAPNILWTKTFGGSGIDRGFSVKQTTDGGFIISGTTESNTWLIKTDENGDTLWTKTYGGGGGINGHSVQQTNEGGFVVLGAYQLIKTDSVGNYQWHRDFYSEEDHGEYYYVEQTEDNGYIICGSYGGMYIIKTDVYGNEEWNNHFDSGIAYEIKQTEDNGFIIVGMKHRGFQQGRAIKLIKTDENGNEQWSFDIGEWHTDNYGFSVDFTNDGGYILTGTIFIDDEYYLDLFLMKTDADGNILWSNNYGGVGGQKGNCVKTIDDGYIITYSNGGNYLIRTDINGNTIWQIDLNGNTTYLPSLQFQQTNNQGFIVIEQTPDGSDIKIVRLESEFRADFTANPTFGYNQLEVNFSDESPGNPISWQWDFQNDGIIDSYVQNPTYTYSGQGIYDVKLIANDGVIIDTLVKNDYITIESVPPASPSNVQIEITGYDVLLSWCEVDTTIFGTPIDVDFYLVYGSYNPYNDFMFVGATSDTTFIQNYVTLLYDQMFYRVESFVGTREELEDYVERYLRKPEENYIIER